ncbi:YkgJ family cysteine cluster protein [Pontibacter populi]|uniref:YkgJ family cysteine cluster protein n=1 Tax=Pontibacter populi TaxID=890055 RepID=A0ABV1RR95_9BACT
MSDSTNLCLACGLCCNGTLIGFVQLDSEELPVLRELLDLENTNGEGFFLQPCKKFCDGCTIYSKRPKQCAKYECELLKSVEQKEIDFDTAIETIQVVKQQKIAIEKQLALLPLELKSESFYFKMVELNRFFQNSQYDSSLPQTHLNLMSDLAQLESLLLKRFGISFS